MEFSDIAMTVIGALVGVIGFFVKKAFTSLDNKATKEELEEVKKDIESDRASINKIKDRYLTKEDFYREQSKTDKKLDKIMEILMEIKDWGGPDYDFYKILRDFEDKKLSKMTEEEREAYFEEKERKSIELAKRLKLNVIEMKKLMKKEGEE